jgi:hypothetical protein
MPLRRCAGLSSLGCMGVTSLEAFWPTRRVRLFDEACH